MRLPDDPKGNKPDEWYRCAWADMDREVTGLLQLYWDAQSEHVPVCAGAIDDWPVTTLAMSRIIREEMQHATAKTNTDSGKAAAEAQRKQLEADALHGGRGRGVRRSHVGR